MKVVEFLKNKFSILSNECVFTCPRGLMKQTLEYAVRVDNLRSISFGAL